RNCRQVGVRLLSVRCSHRQFQEARLGRTAQCIPDVVALAGHCQISCRDLWTPVELEDWLIESAERFAQSSLSGAAYRVFCRSGCLGQVRMGDHQRAYACAWLLLELHFQPVRRPSAPPYPLDRDEWIAAATTCTPRWRHRDPHPGHRDLAPAVRDSAQVPAAPSPCAPWSWAGPE